MVRDDAPVGAELRDEGDVSWSARPLTAVNRLDDQVRKLHAGMHYAARGFVRASVRTPDSNVVLKRAAQLASPRQQVVAAGMTAGTRRCGQQLQATHVHISRGLDSGRKCGLSSVGSHRDKAYDRGRSAVLP